MAMPTERELDALVAEKVMGWHLEHMSSYSFQGWHDASGERTGWTEMPDDYDSLRNFIGVWAPSTDIAAAWEVVERFTTFALLYDDATCTWFAYADHRRRTMEDCRYKAGAPTAPLAICRAALKVSAQQRDRDDERDGPA